MEDINTSIEIFEEENSDSLKKSVKRGRWTIIISNVLFMLGLISLIKFTISIVDRWDGRAYGLLFIMICVLLLWTATLILFVRTHKFGWYVLLVINVCVLLIGFVMLYSMLIDGGEISDLLLSIFIPGISVATVWALLTRKMCTFFGLAS